MSQQNTLFLLTSIQWNMVYWERDTWYAQDDSSNGKVVKMIASWYKCRTDEDGYLVFMTEYIKDSLDPENIRLYPLRVINTADKEKEFSDLVEMNIQGVYKSKN